MRPTVGVAVLVVSAIGCGPGTSARDGPEQDADAERTAIEEVERRLRDLPPEPPAPEVTEPAPRTTCPPPHGPLILDDEPAAPPRDR